MAGIPIRLHFTFLLFLVYVGLPRPGGHAWLNVALVITLFLCVVLHELGHSVVAMRYGIPVANITLYRSAASPALRSAPSPSRSCGSRWRARPSTWSSHWRCPWRSPYKHVSLPARGRAASGPAASMAFCFGC